MKQLTILILLIFSAINSPSQPKTTASALINTDYLQKSKRQKTAAFIMLGGGMAVLLTGVIIEATNWDSNVGNVLAAVGALSEVGSIALFIASAKNKKKAMNASVFLKLENVMIIKRSLYTRKTYPAVSITINL